jgi:hypothetical protein
MRKLFGAMFVIAVAAGVCVAQNVSKKPAEKKAGAAHAGMSHGDMAKADSGNTYVGTWKLNTEKSQYPDASMKPKSATLRITKWDANTIAWTYATVDAKGKAMKVSYSAPNDGKPHPVTGDPNAQMADFKTSGNAIAITWSDAKGNTVGTEQTSLSSDGKTFTSKESFKDASGKNVDFTEVYEKSTGAAMNAAKKTSATEKK